MIEVKVYVRTIIAFLRELKGDDLFISGQCVLGDFDFETFFIKSKEVGYQPVFKLKPDKSEETLFLTILSDYSDFKTKRFLSKKERLSVHLCNEYPIMFIFREKDLSEDELKKLDRIRYRGHPSVNPEDNDWIKEKGLIQSTVLKVHFTATFFHEHSPSGYFTLMFK